MEISYEARRLRRNSTLLRQKQASEKATEESTCWSITKAPSSHVDNRRPTRRRPLSQWVSLSGSRARASFASCNNFYIRPSALSGHCIDRFHLEGSIKKNRDSSFGKLENFGKFINLCEKTTRQRKSFAVIIIVIDQNW